MARTDLVIVAADRDGISAVPATAAIADGHMFANNGRRYLLIANGHATEPRTVEVPWAEAVDGETVPAKTITIAAVSTVITDVWPHGYNQASGKVHIDYPDPTDLTISVIESSRV